MVYNVDFIFILLLINYLFYFKEIVRTYIYTPVGNCTLPDMARCRRWVFTLNNYTPVEEGLLQTAEIPFVIYGREIAPGTGTPHLQGYIELCDRGSTLSAVKKILGIDRIHLEQARGSAHECIVYCSKDGNVFQSGNRNQAKVPAVIWRPLFERSIQEREYQLYLEEQEQWKMEYHL